MFDEFLMSSVENGLKDGKKVSHFPCDTCKKKQAIIEQYNRLCIKEYIPPYIDKECNDFKMALIIEKIDEEILIKVFKYFILKTSIKEIIELIIDLEWKYKAETLIKKMGLRKFIEKNFESFNKALIMDMLFDINFCSFDSDNVRNLDEFECIDMLKFYITLSLRDKIKESLVKMAKLIECELEYKIAVIESEIRYYIKCILQEIVITPLPATNYNINFFNKIGSLTEILSIENGIGGGKHDQRSDFKYTRDTIRKYEKVVRTTFDALNDKIVQYNKLIKDRHFIVGVTGICEKVNQGDYHGGGNIIMPPAPCVILNPPNK